MMDIMTAAIGCLVLILIAVLIIILVANIVVYIGDPENLDIAGDFPQYVNLTFENADQPFPEGNIDYVPYYIDVHHDKLIFYPGEEVMPVRDLREEVKESGLRLGYELFEADKEVEFRILDEMAAQQRPRAAPDDGESRP